MDRVWRGGKRGIEIQALIQIITHTYLFCFSNIRYLSMTSSLEGPFTMTSSFLSFVSRTNCSFTSCTVFHSYMNCYCSPFVCDSNSTQDNTYNIEGVGVEHMITILLHSPFRTLAFSSFSLSWSGIVLPAAAAMSEDVLWVEDAIESIRLMPDTDLYIKQVNYELEMYLLTIYVFRPYACSNMFLLLQNCKCMSKYLNDQCIQR